MDKSRSEQTVKFCGSAQIQIRDRECERERERASDSILQENKNKKKNQLSIHSESFACGRRGKKLTVNGFFDPEISLHKSTKSRTEKSGSQV